MHSIDSILFRASAVMLCVCALSASPKASALAELFGVPLGLQIENLDDWKCHTVDRSLNTEKVQCVRLSGSPTPFGAYTAEEITFKAHDTKGICVISGVHFLPEAQEDVFDYQTRVSTPWMFAYGLGVPSFPTTRALQTEKNPNHPVFKGASTDEIGMEAGGKILRWSNLGPAKSILQLEAYDVDPKYRPFSEGGFHDVFTEAGVPKEMKINVLLLTLYSDFWQDCNVP